MKKKIMNSEDVKDLSPQEVLTIHREIWTEISRRKAFCTEKEGIARELGYDFFHGCVACEVAGQSYLGVDAKRCLEKCPLDWGTFDNKTEAIVYCERKGSLYRTWRLYDAQVDRESCSRIAAQIAIMPLRDFGPKPLPVRKHRLQLNGPTLMIDDSYLAHLEQDGTITIYDNSALTRGRTDYNCGNQTIFSPDPNHTHEYEIE